MIFFLAGEDLGAVFLGASTELSEVADEEGFFLARSSYLDAVLFLVMLLPLDFFEFFLEVVVAAEEEEESDILLGRCLSSK